MSRSCLPARPIVPFHAVHVIAPSGSGGRLLLRGWCPAAMARGERVGAFTQDVSENGE